MRECNISRVCPSDSTLSLIVSPPSSFPKEHSDTTTVVYSMTSAGRRSLDSVRRLLQSARGKYAPSAPEQAAAETFSPTGPPLRCFPLRADHVGSLSSMDAPTPNDFHSHLCRKIRNAKRRVNLASLYVGTGTSQEEQEFLDALADIHPHVQVKLLLDENRATRPVSQPNTLKKTSSAEAVYRCLEHRAPSDGGLYLFQALHEPQRSLLPSPLNEIAGVFHVKAYIVDDELILSGANLSQEYFHDRQDRYMLFTNGGGGIVDFYADLIDILCKHSYRYRDSSRQSSTKQELMASLSQIMDGSKDDFLDESNDIVAYAIPTFQAPEGFFPANLDFSSDAELTRNLLLTAHEMDSATTVLLASAYLNPRTELTLTLSVFQSLHLLTAGPKSHGFAPKPGQSRRGDWVPSIFSALYAELENKLPHADFLYYERNGWTFHAKGLWVLNKKTSLVAAVVGSGNYGARSEVMDVESNTILVFAKDSSNLQETLLQEWKSLCQHAHQGHAIEFPETSWKVKAALPFIRNLF